MLNNSILEKAIDFISQNNLIDTLQKYGKTTIVGSYRMQSHQLPLEHG